MIKEIKLIDFRSFSKKEIRFNDGINLISGNNGSGKTNILEAIGVLFGNNVNKIPPYNLVKNGKDEFFLYGKYINHNGIENDITFSFNKNSNTKIVFINKKRASKKIYEDNIIKIVNFFPIHMNLFLLGPKYRRDYIDGVIKNVYPEFREIIKKYDEVVKSRNKTLKNIREKKSNISELNFWNKLFISYSIEIYKYRYKYINFIKSSINKSNVFISSSSNITFKYISKIEENNIENTLKNYINKDIDKQILLGKTSFGPHIDDFDILVDDISLINYASRGEIKSIIIELKLIESNYIKETSNNNPIFLIDDILSELDDSHLELILNRLKNNQIIITSIEDSSIIKGNKIFL